jgi:hypothetical protein
MSFCLLHLKQSYFCHSSLYIYFPRDILSLNFSLHLSPYISHLSRGNPDFCQERGHWLEGSPDSQSVSLLRSWRESVKESMVSGGGLWHVWLCLHHHLELDGLQPWRNKLDKQIKRPGAELREKPG